MSALLTTHDLQTKKAPAKRWRNWWVVIRSFYWPAEQAIVPEGDEFEDEDVWPSQETAEQKAHDEMRADPRTTEFLKYIGAYPEEH